MTADPSYRPAATPPPPPPPSLDPAAVPPSFRPTGTARVRLIMSDGSENALPDDPELAARAEYLVNGILKPPPPA